MLGKWGMGEAEELFELKTSIGKRNEYTQAVHKYRYGFERFWATKIAKALNSLQIAAVGAKQQDPCTRQWCADVPRLSEHCSLLGTAWLQKHGPQFGLICWVFQTFCFLLSLLGGPRGAPFSAATDTGAHHSKLVPVQQCTAVLFWAPYGQTLISLHKDFIHLSMFLPQIEQNSVPAKISFLSWILL